MAEDKELWDGLTLDASPSGTDRIVKQSGADQDFDSVAINNVGEAKFAVSAAGDLVYADGAQSLARLALGNAGDVLAVNSGETAPEWFRLASLSHNLINNYPSVENADGAEPDWWNTSNCTLTEEDETGESLSDYPRNERILKGVTSAAGGYFYQTFVPADERLLNASNTIVSVGAWIYVVTAGTFTLEVADSSTGSISTDTTTTTGGWVYKSVLAQTIGANTLEVRFKHSANSATFYVANPVLNTGGMVASFKPRGLVRKEKYSNFYSADPGGSTAGWQDSDIGSITSNLAVLVDLTVAYYNTTSTNNYIRVRRKGDTGDTIAHEAIRNRDTVGYRAMNTLTVPLNDNQTFQYSSNANAGDTETLSMSVRGYWEWE